MNMTTATLTLVLFLSALNRERIEQLVGPERWHRVRIKLGTVRFREFAPPGQL
jgi:hypothetical protein